MHPVKYIPASTIMMKIDNRGQTIERREISLYTDQRHIPTHKHKEKEPHGPLHREVET